MLIVYKGGLSVKKRYTKLISLVVTLVFLLTVCAGCGGGGDANANEVKIGNILPLSGSAAPLGKIGQQARDMAVEEINEAGGIKSLDGAKIKMVYADSKGDPATGVAEAERLITQENVSLITGCYQSGVAMPSTEVAERYQVPYFVPVPSEDVITERDFKYVFRFTALGCVCTATSPVVGAQASPGYHTSFQSCFYIFSVFISFCVFCVYF
jgi:branched-chain amino acid transport system substrate-binding protein